MIENVKSTLEELFFTLLQQGFAFHNINHTVNVVKMVERNAQLCHVEGRLLQLITLAAWFHDTGYIKGYDGHEDLSVLIFEKHNLELEITTEEKDFISSLILATKVPQHPTNIYEQILCDADLDYLGRPDFDQISQLLFQEWMNFNRVTSQHEFDIIQLDFFQKHQYHLPQIRALRNEGKKINENKIRHRLHNQV